MKALTSVKNKKIGKRLTLVTTPKRLLISAALTTLFVILTLINTTNFLASDTSHGVSLYVSSLLMAFGIGVLCCCKWEISGVWRKLLNFISIASLPVLSMIMVEVLNGVYINEWDLRAVIINCVIYSLIYVLIYSITGSRRLPFIITTPIYFIISLTNHFVTSFRGTPFTPFDFTATKTAATVVGSYNLSFNHQIVFSLILAVFICVLAWQITSKKNSIKKIVVRVLCAVLPIAFFVSYYTSDAIANLGFSPDFFNQARGYHDTGVIPSFLFNAKYISMQKPKDYDPSKISDVIEEIKNGTDSSINTPIENGKTPNLICIMNESLTDYSVIGELKTNKDCLPFLHSLSENTIKGNVYVPVIGAGTSNSEFEFLTGTTTAFLPAGSNAYTLYVKNELSTLTNTLEKQGYSSVAFHPYFSYNWNRDKVYEYMNFDNFYGVESFLDKKTVDAYINGTSYENLKQMVSNSLPNDKNVLLRDVVSDEFNYKKVIELYEQRESDKPFYIFNVTMQNHGGYETPYQDFNEEIYLVNKEGEKREDMPQTNQYLSLLYESDKAFKELVEYFEKQDEPTIICMFGDHQPKVETGFYQEIHNVETLFDMTTEQTQDRYKTPFYIWANYDIEEKDIDKISVNYLSSYLLEVAGLQLTEFNKYLLNLSKTLPVIDTVGYIDSENNYYTYSQNTKHSGLIEGYKKVCYNYLFDQRERCGWLFDLDE